MDDPPDEQLMSTKQGWLGGQYDVCLFVPFSFVPVDSAGSRLTVQCARMSKSQGQTRELNSVRSETRLDAPTEFWMY